MCTYHLPCSKVGEKTPHHVPVFRHVTPGRPPTVSDHAVHAAFAPGGICRRLPLSLVRPRSERPCSAQRRRYKGDTNASGSFIDERCFEEGAPFYEGVATLGVTQWHGNGGVDVVEPERNHFGMFGFVLLGVLGKLSEL